MRSDRVGDGSPKGYNDAIHTRARYIATITGLFFQHPKKCQLTAQ